MSRYNTCELDAPSPRFAGLIRLPSPIHASGDSRHAVPAPMKYRPDEEMFLRRVART